jgi:hypothetical protein
MNNDHFDESGQLLQTWKEEIMSSIHCALPGTVVSFDAESQTAVIQPTIKTSSDVEFPLLRDVPVFMPVSFEIQEGDACLVIFADRDIDAWFEMGEAEVPPSSRMHSLSDGFAFVGFRTRRNADENASDG